jgi:MarR family transcriptional regulator for hemolysin
VPSRPQADDLDALRLAYTHTLLLTGRHWRRAANAVMEAHGLSDATAIPLIMIARLDGAPRQNALAEAVGIEGLSLTRAGTAIVARMEAELAALRAEVFAQVGTADLEASLRVFEAVQAYGRAAAAPRD